jgi:hypothetical protein
MYPRDDVSTPSASLIKSSYARAHVGVLEAEAARV